MKKAYYPLINPYPIEDISESELCNPILSVLYPNCRRQCVANAIEHAMLVASGENAQGLDMALTSTLRESSSYIECTTLNSVEELSNLKKYRTTYRSFEEADADDLAVLEMANQELLSRGRPLAFGQALFHGGVWPRDINGTAPLPFFSSSRILSATLLVGIAQWHAEQHNPKEIWVITVTNSSIPAFFYSHTGFLGYEFEVAIAAGAVFEYHSEKKYHDVSVIHVILR